MIVSLHGTLLHKEPMRVIVEVHGVGYELAIPLSSHDRLPAEGAPVRLLTYFHVREDIQALYGFATEDERRLFLLLIGVSERIGPRTALSALSGLSARDFKAAVVQGDIKRLSSISGIGKKTAERIVVELRDKLSAGEALEAIAGGKDPTADDLRLRDAILALISLGYKQADAQAAVRKVMEKGAAASVEDIIRRALAL